ncbi:hypothetical protein HY605_00305, partial [Candidatus Peregrinibacteria bacterium]|nr:hypothetical protein [Candidatus Peregrinibacteria bacterium]
IKESDVREFLESRTTGPKAGAERSDAEAKKKEPKPEQVNPESKPHYDINKNNDDQHYYII